MSDIIDMEYAFRDRLKASIRASGLIVKEISSLSGVSKRTIENWTSAEGRIPRADDAARVAMVIGTTVEELAEGEKGRDYVLSLASRSGALYQAPPRIAKIVNEFTDIPDDDLEMLYSMVHACAEKSRRLSRCEDRDTG